MDFIVGLAESFIGFFQASGETIAGNIMGTIPTLLALLFLVQFLIRLIGDKKINKAAEVLGKSRILSYLVLPTFAWFFLSSPGALTVGKFLPEKRKPGFQDALGRTVHPLTSLFPHIVPAELFIWLGIASGIQALGLPIGGLAIRAIIVALIVGLISGIVTEKIFLYMLAKKDAKEGQNG
ncbi:MAG: PTS glucitol/sorbitol transporter subunit IIC [Defluviitaleaceae bacterium]|nr:PTS glucitol/sorbitol transporter subunit IIC [Defluviitaleaceae bacterium]